VDERDIDIRTSKIQNKKLVRAEKKNIHNSYKSNQGRKKRHTQYLQNCSGE
jgi:hypothetical protein